MLQRQPIQKLHGNERLPIFLPNVINRADIRVVQHGCSLCFSPKTAQGLRIFGHVVGQKLESHETIKARVFSFVNHAHAAATELLGDAVVRDGLADHSTMWRERTCRFQVASSYGRTRGPSTQTGEEGRERSQSALPPIPCARSHILMPTVRLACSVYGAYPLLLSASLPCGVLTLAIFPQGLPRSIRTS